MLFQSVVVLLLVLSAVITVIKHKLSPLAGIVGFMIALCILFAVGTAGVALMSAFFLLGTTATAWKSTYKRDLSLAEANLGQRKASQVWANAGTACILALAALYKPAFAHSALLGIAASFSSATADTLSSELGNLYGSRYFNILNLKQDRRGLDGVVSLEGTALGVAGSIFIALVYGCFEGFSTNLLYIVIAGTAGNIADSILGATFERRGWIKNDAVNFLNTLVAGVVVAILSR